MWPLNLTSTFLGCCSSKWISLLCFPKREEPFHGLWKSSKIHLFVEQSHTVLFNAFMLAASHQKWRAKVLVEKSRLFECVVTVSCCILARRCLNLVRKSDHSRQGFERPSSMHSEYSNTPLAFYKEIVKYFTRYANPEDQYSGIWVL